MSAELNQPAPDFELATLDGDTHQLSDYRGDVVVVDFWSAECPVSREYDAYFNRFVDRFDDDKVVLLAIDSNAYDEATIADALAERDLDFPVLRDAGNEVADAYGATTTPHIFVVDQEGTLRFRGHVDDRSWEQKEATTDYLAAVVEALLLGEEPPVTEQPAYGCTINRVAPVADDAIPVHE